MCFGDVPGYTTACETTTLTTGDPTTITATYIAGDALPRSRTDAQPGAHRSPDIEPQRPWTATTPIGTVACWLSNTHRDDRQSCGMHLSPRIEVRQSAEMVVLPSVVVCCEYVASCRRRRSSGPPLPTSSRCVLPAPVSRVGVAPHPPLPSFLSRCVGDTFEDGASRCAGSDEARLQ